MENLWNVDFVKKEINTPKEIIEKQCDFLREKTSGYVVGKLSSLKPADSSSFNYEFYIGSTFLTGFKYTIFSIHHTFSLYPCTININEYLIDNINENDQFEISDDSFSVYTKKVTCHDEASFLSFLELLFSNENLVNTISSIMTLAIKEEKKV